MFSACTSDTLASANSACPDVIFSSGFFLKTMARYDHMVRTWTDCIFHYTDYDIIVHGRGRKCSYFLITRVFQSSSNYFQWQIVVSHSTKPSVGMQPAPTSMESSALACQVLYNWGIYLCRPQLLNMPDRSGSVPSQRSISHRRASAIRRFRKVNAQLLQSKVTDSCSQPRPPQRCDCCFKELSDSSTSLYSAAPTPLQTSSSALPSLLPVVFFSQLLWLNAKSPRGASDFPSLTVTVVKAEHRVLKQGQTSSRLSSEWSLKPYQ